MRGLGALTLLALLTTACASEPGADEGETAGDTDTDTSETDTGTDTDETDPNALYACEEDAPEASPLFGPGVDPDTGELVGLDQAEYVVHTTQVYLAPGQDDSFDELVDGIVEQAMATPGLIAVSLGNDPTCGFKRTLGIWESEAAMTGFVVSGAHATAMGQTATLTITGRTTHWTVATEDLSDLWAQAFAELEGVSPFY